MIIAVMGTPCSGKSTVARLLAEHYEFKHYSAGDMRRQAARDRGLTLVEFNKLGEEGDTDTMFEEIQRKLGKTEDDFVIDGRMSALMIPEAISVYINADVETRAQRLLGDPHHENDPITTLKEAMRYLAARVQSDKSRFKKQYDYDPYDPSHYDIVIDSTHMSAKEVVAEIVRALDSRKT